MIYPPLAAKPASFNIMAMTALKCKACQAETYTKNGTVRGLQRYRCKICGCNFTDTPPRGKPAAVKALAVLL